MPAYRKQEQSNSSLPTSWFLGRVRERIEVLVSMLTRERLMLIMVLLFDFALKSTNTLPLLRASWKEGQMLSPAKAEKEKKSKEKYI